jgi:DNA gyrase subunit A
MQLRRLAALERQRSRTSTTSCRSASPSSRTSSPDPERVRTIIKDELTEIREKFADGRRSRIVPDDGAMSVEDLIPESDVVLTLSRAGYVKRTPVEAFRTQRRGGKGVRGAEMREDDIVSCC